MPLSAGTRLGAYEVLASIGAGGMGEVFRARDVKLNRDVALKILPEAFVSDPDRLARFTREAQTLASLNHPSIAAIYGIEESNNVRALVMELVDGEDLSAQIARGPMPLAEVLPIARQITDALEAAHERGIVHRDLKPANIKVRADGTVKVLDFGLAKAVEWTGGAGRPGGAGGDERANSPTLSMHATQAGIILGTAAYMSPEQAAGKPVDKRSDLWAFGVVVFEMLTGEPVFNGETVSHVLAALLKSDPDWKALPADAPAPIRRLLRRCLEKDRRRRLDSAAAARLEIDDALSPSPAAADAAAAPAAAPRSSWSRALPLAVAGMFGVGLVAELLLWPSSAPARVPEPRKLLVSLGADASLTTDLGASAILSPDGSTLAFVAQQAGQTRLFIRKLDQLQAAALAGTEGAASPFFSPEGHWIAFFADRKLKKVSVTGGAAIDLCDAPAGRGGTWTDDDTIIFTPANISPNATLMRISTGGGIPAVFGTLSKGAVTQRWPEVLPGGKVVLYTEHSEGTNWDGANLVVAPLAGGTPKVIARGGYYGRYVPSHHLIYMRQGTLFAVPFDLDRLETIGQAVPALEGLSANPGVTGGAQLALSSEGTLVYVPGTGVTSENHRIDWMTRDGKTSALRMTKANWLNPRFSPDGQKLALDISDGKQRDIWVYEWARDTLTQLTFDPGQDQRPVWSPNGRKIVFASDRGRQGINNLYWVNADGTGEVTRLTDTPNGEQGFSWHPSGRFLAFHENRGATGMDSMILPMEGDAAGGWTPGKPIAFLSTQATEVGPMFSPDGRWIAYVSNEAGSSSGDVYVRPFPGAGGKWRISTDGGILPRWSVTANELLFVNPTQNRLMFVQYTVVGDSFHADMPQVWSPTSIRAPGIVNSYSSYDLHPDGKRVATVVAQDQGNLVQDKVVFVFNFFDYLRKIAPTATR